MILLGGASNDEDDGGDCACDSDHHEMIFSNNIRHSRLGRIKAPAGLLVQVTKTPTTTTKS